MGADKGNKTPLTKVSNQSPIVGVHGLPGTADCLSFCNIISFFVAGLLCCAANNFYTTSQPHTIPSLFLCHSPPLLLASVLLNFVSVNPITLFVYVLSTERKEHSVMFFSRARLLVLFFLLALLLFFTSSLAAQLYLLLRLPFIWPKYAGNSIISQDRDNFDVTFRAYNGDQSPSEPERPPLIPARLHHVHLGAAEIRPEWMTAREECLKLHPDWETHVWNDTTANAFVRENFPGFRKTWENYPYLVQKVDALRYMVLYKYGGAILDLDLVCKRSLEPLRRFDFVAPAAHPAGFSIGMLLSSANNTFVGDLIYNLPRFNRRWLLLPYVTVMFSTGCHYASTIYTTQLNRTSLRILSGPPDHPTMHMLNGFVDTPLFRHLGTSSWHANDALFVKVIERIGRRALCGILSAAMVGGCIITYLIVVARRRPAGREKEVEETSTSISKLSEKVV